MSTKPFERTPSFHQEPYCASQGRTSESSSSDIHTKPPRFISYSPEDILKKASKRKLDMAGGGVSSTKRARFRV